METWRDRPHAANASREPEVSCFSSPCAPSRAITHKRSKEEEPGKEEQFYVCTTEGWGFPSGSHLGNLSPVPHPSHTPTGHNDA